MYTVRSSFKKIFFLIVIFAYTKTSLIAQSKQVIGRCGGSYFVTHPAFTDKDQDGLSDTLEQVLLHHFVPTIIQFTDEKCPGPSIGTANSTDTNLVVCRIFPLFQQYIASNDVSLIQNNPSPLINEKCLHAGLVWYDNLIVIYGAVLYGRDCGLHGHIGDIEGFSVSIKYIGSNDDLSWRYDTSLNNWEGVKIQTISHAGTFCEEIETFPYLSSRCPNGKDTVFASPNKHGNYLTKHGCNSSFICNPSCNNTPSVKKIKIINVGELAAPLITDLGIYYSGYGGENPWSNTKFLAGGAGTIKAKMLKAWSSDFVFGQTINSCNDICSIYNNCYNFGSKECASCINDCQSIDPAHTGCNSPVFNCSGPTSNPSKSEIK